jgi:hypothetical protein
MSVGNFKRSTGPMVPIYLSTKSRTFKPPSRFDFPELSGGIHTVAKARPTTWRFLTSVNGLGVPSATTLLSAVWPEAHIIIDVRDTRAAVAVLRGSAWRGKALDGMDLPTRDAGDDTYWDVYEAWFRPTVLQTSEATKTAGVPCSPLEIERALYELDKKVMKTLPRTWSRSGTWSQYFAEAKKHL